MKSFKLIFIALGALLLLAGCGQGKQSSNASVTLNQASADVAALYKSNCMSCHAIDLSGKMGEQTNLQHVNTRLSYDEIVEQIANGGTSMSAFKERLSTEEINALAAWLSKQ